METLTVICTACKHYKELCDFPPEKRNTGRHQRSSWCRECTNNKKAARRKLRKEQHPKPHKPLKPPQICSFDTCGKVAVKKGWCVGHYTQQKREQPLRPIKPGINKITVSANGAAIELYNRTGGVVGAAIIDSADLSKITGFTWAKSSRGYVVASCANSNKQIKLHRLLMEPAPHLEVDHINGDPLDNRRANLRIVNRVQQGQNVATKGRERYRGVYFSEFTGAGKHKSKRKKPWYAAVFHAGFRYKSKWFETGEEARAAAVTLRNEHLTHNVEERHQ